MIQPLRSDVLVKLDEKQHITDGGIHIPDTAQEQPITGTVIAVGPQQTDIKPGDRVLMGKYNGTAVESMDDAEYRVCKADFEDNKFPDIYGVIEE